MQYYHVQESRDVRDDFMTADQRRPLHRSKAATSSTSALCESEEEHTKQKELLNEGDGP